MQLIGRGILYFYALFMSNTKQLIKAFNSVKILPYSIKKWNCQKKSILLKEKLSDL